MKKKISISSFTSGLNLGQFHTELKSSTFSAKYKKVKTDKGSVFIRLLSELTPTEETELNTLVTNHVSVAPTPIELKGDVLLNQLDYHKARAELIILATTKGFAAMTDKEKEISAKFCLVGGSTIRTHYQSQGLTAAEARIKYRVNRAKDITRAAQSCAYRASTAVIRYIALKHMTEDIASTFLNDIKQFLPDYTNIAHLGTAYPGQSRDGIVDFINATSTYNLGGLSTYTFRSGTTYVACRDELVNYLVNGIEPTEFIQYNT